MSGMTGSEGRSARVRTVSTDVSCWGLTRLDVTDGITRLNLSGKLRRTLRMNQPEGVFASRAWRRPAFVCSGAIRTRNSNVKCDDPSVLMTVDWCCFCHFWYLGNLPISELLPHMNRKIAQLSEGP